VRLIQLSDLHLTDAVDRLVNGFPVYDSFRQIFHSALALRPDYILCTGDLSDDGTVGSYQILEAILARTSIPVSILYGNHDRPLLNSRYQKFFLLGDWQVLCVDSVKPDSIWGEGKISESELEWLREQLQNSDRSTIIALHHHPILLAGELSWLNQIGLENRVEFINLIQSFPQVRAVIFGHMHRAFAQELCFTLNPCTSRRGEFIQYQPCRYSYKIHLWGAPSTCYQVVTSAEKQHNSGQGWAGFRVIDLLEYQRMSSFVVRLLDCPAMDVPPVVVH